MAVRVCDDQSLLFRVGHDRPGFPDRAAADGLRSKRDEYLRLTRFFGVLLVINVAIGVVTGLVQEFQFGMNWSAHSRLVGNVFGAPLATDDMRVRSGRLARWPPWPRSG